MSSDPTSPPKLAASFYDGRVSRAHAVELHVGAQGIVLIGPSLQREYAWNATGLSERLQRAPRLIRFADGGHCEVIDQSGLDGALAAVGYRDSWVARSQRRWSFAAVALVLLAAAVFAIYRWELPAVVDLAVARIPPRVEDDFGIQAARIVEQQFAPTRLSGVQADRAWRVFESIAPHDGRDFRLVLREGGPVGANAFALPGGTVVVTDELVRLAADDAALAGVLAHEIGHVERRHLLRQMISSSVVGAVVTLIAGDVSGVLTALPAALANLSYSRDMEREADSYAVNLLKSKGIAVEPFADLLQRLQSAHGTGEAAGGVRYLQTHPDSGERIAAIRAAR